MERRRKVWMDGFRAGQERLSRCPYPPGSADARDWLEGAVIYLSPIYLWRVRLHI